MASIASFQQVPTDVQIHILSYIGSIPDFSKLRQTSQFFRALFLNKEMHRELIFDARRIYLINSRQAEIRRLSLNIFIHQNKRNEQIGTFPSLEDSLSGLFERGDRAINTVKEIQENFKQLNYQIHLLSCLDGQPRRLFSGSETVPSNGIQGSVEVRVQFVLNCRSGARFVPTSRCTSQEWNDLQIKNQTPSSQPSVSRKSCIIC